MSNEHFPPHAKEKSAFLLMSDEYVNEQFNEIATLYDHTEAEEPTYEEHSEYTKQVHDIGEVALEAAGVVAESTGPMATEQRFWNTTPDEMDKMPDDEVLEAFYRPDELPSVVSPQNERKTTLPPMETEASPQGSNKEQAPFSGPEAYERFSDKQLEQIKANLLDSLAETLSSISDKREYGSDAVPGETDSERITQNLININLEIQHRTPEETHKESPDQDERIYLPNQLSDSDTQAIIDKLPKNRKVILPIYRMYIRLLARADNAKNGERRSFLDRATVFNGLASRLMLDKSAGWDDIYVDNLRQWHAADHPELKIT